MGGRRSPLTLDRRFGYVTLERGLIVASKAVTVVLIARLAGPAALSVYAVGLAIAVWSGSLANFGLPIHLQRRVAQQPEAVARLGTDGVGSSLTLGLFLAVPAGLVHVALTPGEPAVQVAIATALLVPSSAVTHMMGSLIKGRNDFLGHLYGNAAEYLFFPVALLLMAWLGDVTGVRSLLLFTASIWISNTIWWFRLSRKVRLRLRSPANAIRDARSGRYGAGFQLGEAGAARADLLVLATVASPHVVGVYALVKQIVEAGMHVPRVGGAITLNDAAQGTRDTRWGRFVLSGVQGLLMAPLVLVPAGVLQLAGGPAYRIGADGMRVLALAGLVWGWAYLRAHEEFGIGTGVRATRWALTLVMLMVPLVPIGYVVGELTGAAIASLVAYLLAGTWLWKPARAASSEQAGPSRPVPAAEGHTSLTPSEEGDRGSQQVRYGASTS